MNPTAYSRFFFVTILLCVIYGEAMMLPPSRLMMMANNDMDEESGESGEPEFAVEAQQPSPLFWKTLLFRRPPIPWSTIGQHLGLKRLMFGGRFADEAVAAVWAEIYHGLMENAYPRVLLPFIGEKERAKKAMIGLSRICPFCPTHVDNLTAAGGEGAGSGGAAGVGAKGQNPTRSRPVSAPPQVRGTNMRLRWGK